MLGWLLAAAGLLCAAWFFPLRRKRNTTSSREAAMKVTDPVCGMQVDPAKAAAQAEHQGKTYYFCSESCRKQFGADPGKYAGQTPAHH